jgi:hypothetical protein
MKFLRRLTGGGTDPGPARPLPNTYWVQPGQLLAGEYPGSPEDEEMAERLARLVAAGIDAFFDLTEAGEREEYSGALPAGIEYQRLPIEDHGLPQSADHMAEIVAALGRALTAGRKCYVHCRAGIGIWDWAGTDDGATPDVVLACAGDVPTLEALAAAQILREQLPSLAVRVVNVVDLMTLQPREEHPHGLDDAAFDGLFTTDRPVIFAYHGYPWLIHRLTYRRRNHDNLHVRGYKEEGTTTTPFDMVVLNQLDRFHLVMDVIDRVPSLGYRAAGLKQAMRDRLLEHGRYIVEHGEDLPEIREWRWRPAQPDGGASSGVA